MVEKEEDEKKEKDKDEKGNVYDRMFKENAEHIFIPLVEQELGIEIKNYRALPEKITKTIEREMDFFYIINEKSKDEFMLHLEFQAQNDKEMLYRMAGYHGLAFAKHKMPIRHVVIYLGKAKLNMENELKPVEIFYGFETINIRDMDTSKFLESHVPEIIILALLAAYPKRDATVILRYILQRLKKVCPSEKDLRKYISQLLFFSRLRNLRKVTNKIINDMPIKYDISKDPLFLQGIKEERARTKEEKVKAREEIKKITARSEEKVAKSEEREKQFYLKLLSFMQIKEITTKFDVSAEYLKALTEAKDKQI